MSQPTVIRGISTPEEFAEHIRRVELYIAGEDQETNLLRKLHRRIKHKGVKGVSTPQRLFYAYHQFAGAMFGGQVNEFFDYFSTAILHAVDEGFRTIEKPDLSDVFNALWRAHKAGEIEEDGTEESLERTAPFIDQLFELDRLFLHYAEKHRLFR
ncbi:MAG: hypothetical protein ACI8PT_000489 [Gammaproteobacteria bacterium]|jgi:hypothetical protein